MAGKPFGNAQMTQEEINEIENSILLEFQTTVNTKVRYTRHPENTTKGAYGPDAHLSFPDWSREYLAECRQKACTKHACSEAHPEKDIPHPGVEISARVFEQHGGEIFLYLVRFMKRLEYAWVDPLISYNVGDCLNRKDDTKSCSVFIPVADFHPIHKFPSGLGWR